VTVPARVEAVPCPFGLGEVITELGRRCGAANPLGTGHEDAAVRLRCARTFAAGGPPVERVVRAIDGRWDLYTRVMNLGGAGGTLPDALDRLAFDPAGADPALLAALDRWTHAAVSAWFRVWAAHPAVARARPDRPEVVRSLFARPRTFARLARVVGWFVDAPAAVVPCTGSWTIRRGHGDPRPTFTRLGRCRLVIGPAAYETFARLREAGTELRELLQLADEFCDGMVGFEVVVATAERVVPPADRAARGVRVNETYQPHPAGTAVAVIPAGQCDELLERRVRPWRP
jgi:predicted component of type VI protein secretion system